MISYGHGWYDGAYSDLRIKDYLLISVEGDPAGDNLRLTNQIHPPVSSHQSSTSWIIKKIIEMYKR